SLNEIAYIEDVQSIIFVGRTGCGKSTLANVLLDDEKFDEIAGSTSGTKRIQNEIFEWNGNKYCVIDTVGIGDDSRLSNYEKMLLFCDIFKKRKIKQIFFVYKDRFEDYQVKALEKVNKLLKVYGSKYNGAHIALVCTNFAEFENNDACDLDTVKLLRDRKNQNIVEVIRSCKHIHVDNPPIHSSCHGDGAKRARQSSRRKLPEYLESIASVKCIEVK
ncbi:19577_t:CDS:1, partial [Racocetra fulgida]